MAKTDVVDRVYQSFLRGYRDASPGKGRTGSASDVLPYSALIHAASNESKELRRSIDACRAALAQLSVLPEAEQAQLKIEARSSLHTLQAATDVWLSRLLALRPTEAVPGPAVSAARQASLRPRKSRSRR